MDCMKILSYHDIVHLNHKQHERSLSVARSRNWYYFFNTLANSRCQLHIRAHSELLGQFRESDLGCITLDFMMT